MITCEEAGILPNSKAKGLVWRTFMAKTFACLVLTGMSLYIVTEYWPTMNKSTHIGLKITGCCISFLFLVPSMRETMFLIATLVGLNEEESLEDFMKDTEDWSRFYFMCVMLCCPCSVAYMAKVRPPAWIAIGFIIAFVDSIQTLLLFPLAVVVVMSSDSEVEVLVNIVAVQIFANLDDLFAYGISKYLGHKVLDSTSALYVDWTEETKTSEFDALSKQLVDLTEKVRLLEKKQGEHLDAREDNKTEVGDASKGDVIINIE